MLFSLCLLCHAFLFFSITLKSCMFVSLIQPLQYAQLSILVIVIEHQHMVRREKRHILFLYLFIYFLQANKVNDLFYCFMNSLVGALAFEYTNKNNLCSFFIVCIFFHMYLYVNTRNQKCSYTFQIIELAMNIAATWLGKYFMRTLFYKLHAYLFL